MQSSTAQTYALSFGYDSTASNKDEPGRASVQPLRSGLRKVWSKVKHAIKGDKPKVPLGYLDRLSEHLHIPHL